MSGVGDVTNGDRRRQLEQRADAVRSRLERNLEVLDERRQRFASVARAAAKSPVTVVLIGAAGLTATILIARRIRQASERARANPQRATVTGPGAPCRRLPAQGAQTCSGIAGGRHRAALGYA